MNVQDCTSVYKGEQECIRVNTAVHGFTRLYMGIQFFTCVYKIANGYRRMYMGVQGITSTVQGCMRLCRDVQG